MSYRTYNISQYLDQQELGIWADMRKNEHKLTQEYLISIFSPFKYDEDPFKRSTDPWMSYNGFHRMHLIGIKLQTLEYVYRDHMQTYQPISILITSGTVDSYIKRYQNARDTHKPLVAATIIAELLHTAGIKPGDEFREHNRWQNFKEALIAWTMASRNMMEPVGLFMEKIYNLNPKMHEYVENLDVIKDCIIPCVEGCKNPNHKHNTKNRHSTEKFDGWRCIADVNVNDIM